MEVGQTIRFTKPKDFEYVKALNAGGTGKTILMRDTTINKMIHNKKNMKMSFLEDLQKR